MICSRLLYIPDLSAIVSGKLEMLGAASIAIGAIRLFSVQLGQLPIKPTTIKSGNKTAKTNRMISFLTGIVAICSTHPFTGFLDIVLFCRFSTIIGPKLKRP